MRVSRLMSAAAALTLGAIAAVLGTAPANASGANYVALGDSYSSGVGSGDYGTSGGCERSTHAYPQLWADANAPASFAFTACSGATTTDVINNQLGPLGSSTTLVSITIGGNDAHFADTMETCVLDSESTCLNRIDADESYAHSTLPGDLDRAYDAIRAKAPNARVVVLDYPHLYQLDGTCWLGLSETERSALNGAADTLDDVIQDRAGAHGFVFADVRGGFTTHEICGTGEQWLHSVTWPITDSYHPTRAGQANGYLPAFSSHA
jgi:lysophospholipase L1-like esterase